MSTTRLVVADDHAVFRGALIDYLEKHGMTIAGEASDGMEAVSVTRSARPQIAVLDIGMPIMNGIDDAEEILREPGTQVVILSMHSEPHHVIRAFQAGAAGYVLKVRSGSELLLAISEVKAGNKLPRPEQRADTERDTDAP